MVHAKPALTPPGPLNVFTALLESARDGMRLVAYLHKNNVTRYSMPSVAFCVCHLGETISRYSEDMQEKLEVMVMCLEVMEGEQPPDRACFKLTFSVNRSGFAVCGPLSQILRNNAMQAGVNIDEVLPDHLRHYDEFDVDSVLACTTRLNFAQPCKAMSRWLSPQVFQDWPAAWHEMQEEETRLKSKPMRVTDLLNA